MIEKINNLLYLSLKQFFLNIKFILNNKIIIFSFIFFGVISQVISVIFIPFKFSGAIKMLLAQTSPLLILLGGLSYNWKKSTLNKNQGITSSNKLTIYLSLIITLILIGNIIALFNFFLDLSFSELGLQLNQWIWENNGAISKMYLENINWFVYFYAINLNILVTFSLYFVIHRMVSDIKNYFIAILCLLIFGIIFCGSINNYFLGFNKLNNSIFIYGEYGGNLFPNSFFPISLMFPFYSISEFYQLSIFYSLINSSQNYNFIQIFNFSLNKDQWEWTLILIFPYIHILFSFTLGILLSFLKKDYI